MGKFFTALHIKSNSKDQFVKMFTQLMKKDGYVTCSENEAALSYAATFSEGGWVTLSNGDDSVGELTKLSAKIARDMKTSCFTTEAVDSDFAILELHAPNGRTSRIVVGDGEGYGVEKASFSADDWKPLLQNGDIEKFLAVIGQDSTFVEDDLVEIGNLFGISGFAITADHDELSGNDGAFELSFKKAAEKKIAFNAAFVKVFGEALEPHGFKRIKYKYPCFVRIVGDEIIQIITYMKMKGHPFVDGYERTDCSQYDIVCKVETVYSTEIELPTKNFEKYSSYLGKREIYGREHMFDLDKNYWKKAVKYFPHKSGDEKLTISGLEEAIDLTKQILLPALDGVTDLKSFLEYIYKFYGTPFLDYNPGHYDHLNQYDGLVRIKVDTCESFLKRDEEYRLRGFDRSDKVNKVNCAKDPEKLAHYLGKVDKERNEYISKHEERELFTKQMFGDKEWCEKAFEELERRKAANIETLKGYGVEL